MKEILDEKIETKDKIKIDKNENLGIREDLKVVE